jgi:hypothetical protein
MQGLLVFGSSASTTNFIGEQAANYSGTSDEPNHEDQ